MLVVIDLFVVGNDFFGKLEVSANKGLGGLVDGIVGGFPCQDISYAGPMSGINEGERSSLWSEFARIIRLLKPRFVSVENVPALVFHVVCVLLFCGSLSRKDSFTRVALQPLSKRTFSKRRGCFG